MKNPARSLTLSTECSKDWSHGWKGHGRGKGTTPQPSKNCREIIVREHLKLTLETRLPSDKTQTWPVQSRRREEGGVDSGEEGGGDALPASVPGAALKRSSLALSSPDLELVCPAHIPHRTGPEAC